MVWENNRLSNLQVMAFVEEHAYKSDAKHGEEIETINATKWGRGRPHGKKNQPNKNKNYVGGQNLRNSKYFTNVVDKMNRDIDLLSNSFLNLTKAEVVWAMNNMVRLEFLDSREDSITNYDGFPT